MRADLDDTLCRKYPKIFAQRHAPMTETCMCWGFDVEDGWFALIDKLCADIQAHCDAAGIQVEAMQVKEKFGTLRFYIGAADDVVFDLIDAADELSGKTCESCGGTGSIRSSGGSPFGWLKTLCDACATKVGYAPIEEEPS